MKIISSVSMDQKSAFSMDLSLMDTNKPMPIGGFCCCCFSCCTCAAVMDVSQ